MKTYPNSLLAIVSFHFIVFSLLGLSRHWGYLTSLNDLGCFDQAVWGIIHKGFMLNSFGHPLPINWLGHHFNPILYAFVPLYYLVPSVNWFIFAQSAALSLAALPIFLLAKQIGYSKTQASLWSAVYLFNPFTLNADAWDFHPVSLAAPVIAFAFLALEQQKVSLFIVANIVLLLCQEQFGLTVAAFGLLYGIKNRELRIGGSVMVLGLLSITLILGVIMPALSPSHQHIMFGEAGNPQAERYGWLGHSPKELLKTLFFSPWHVLKTVLFKFKGFLYIKLLFIPLLCTPLAAPLFMLPMAADFLANILAEVYLPHSAIGYHSITIIPVLTVAAMYGCQTIAKKCSLLPTSRLIPFICCLTFIFGYLLAPLPLPFAVNFWKPVHLLAQYDPREDEIKKLLGSHSISVQANIGAHFSQREKIYRFPQNSTDSDYIVLWLNNPTTIADYLYPNSPTAINRIYPRDYLHRIEKLLSDDDLKIAYWNDPWLVFKRGGKLQHEATEIQVQKKIMLLKKTLQNHAISVQ